jgi:hypothetical protein
MINLRAKYAVLALACGAVAVLSNGCELNPQPETPFQPTMGDPTAGGLGGADGEGGAGAGGEVAVDNADAGSPPNVPEPGRGQDAGIAGDAGVPADAGNAPTGNP